MGILLSDGACYEKELEIGYGECDTRETLKLSGVMRRIQEVAQEHLEALGVPFQLLWDKGMVFLLIKVGLQMNRMPRAKEKIRVVTKPHKPKGAQFIREVQFYSGEEKLIQGDTAWVLADPYSHQLLRPSQYPFALPLESGVYDCPVLREKIQKPQEVEQSGIRTVRYTDLDHNSHMNNAVYSDIVCDFLPPELLLSQPMMKYLIHFVNEAKLGEDLSISQGQMEDGSWYLGADKLDGTRCFDARIQF